MEDKTLDKGYIKLFHAVLEDGLVNIRRFKRTGKKKYKQDYDWLMEDGDHVFAANHVCAVLGVDIEKLRTQLSKRLC